MLSKTNTDIRYFSIYRYVAIKHIRVHMYLHQMLLMILVADRTVIERQIERYYNINMLNTLYLKNEFRATVYNLLRL